MDGSYVDALTDLLIGNHKNATEKTGFKGYMDEVRYYKKVMTPAQIQSIYKVYSENAVTNIDITVDTSKEVREISKAMFGINHRYHNNAYSSWNASEKKVEAKFNEYVKKHILVLYVIQVERYPICLTGNAASDLQSSERKQYMDFRKHLIRSHRISGWMRQ